VPPPSSATQKVGEAHDTDTKPVPLDSILTGDDHPSAAELDVVTKPTVNDEITANADSTFRERRPKPPAPAFVRPCTVGLMRQTHFL
jgi:hypothetical protein